MYSVASTKVYEDKDRNDTMCPFHSSEQVEAEDGNVNMDQNNARLLADAGTHSNLLNKVQA